MTPDGKKVLLVIDDEQTYLNIITQTLKEQNVKILQALNGEMGCMVAQKFMPDIIITDWEMPVMNGIEVINQLKTSPLTKDIPIIMCTGAMTTSEHLKMALDAGAIDYIRKPIDPIEIAARIQSTIKLSDSYKKIKQLNATKDKFFSIIAHDLKNPFNAILGFSELLQQTENISTDETKEFSKMIYDAAQNTFKLLENLLEWSRTQAQKISFSPEHFDLHQLITDISLLLKLQADLKQINIETRLTDQLPINADKNMISTILRNLLSNAIKYTPNLGSIIIQTSLNDNAIIVSVKDSGVGIHEDTIKKLFKIEEKVSTLGTNEETGTGLGLILCKEFVEKHDGKIWVESVVGKGSDFKFTLPYEIS